MSAAEVAREVFGDASTKGGYVCCIALTRDDYNPGHETPSLLPRTPRSLLTGTA